MESEIAVPKNFSLLWDELHVWTLWLSKFKSLYFKGDDWLLAFYLRTLGGHFKNLSQGYHGKHQESHQVFLSIVPCRPYLQVYVPLEQYWNKLHYIKTVKDNSQSLLQLQFELMGHNHYHLLYLKTETSSHGEAGLEVGMLRARTLYIMAKYT